MITFTPTNLSDVLSVGVALLSLLVSAAAAWFSYRASFGWRPILCVAWHTMDKLFDFTGELEIVVHIEIWNRRKYAITTGPLNVVFARTELLSNAPYSLEKEWMIGGKVANRARFEVVESMSRLPIILRAPTSGYIASDIRDLITIASSYFDPRSSRTRHLKIRHVFSMTSHRMVRAPWWMFWAAPNELLRRGRSRVIH